MHQSMENTFYGKENAFCLKQPLLTCRMPQCMQVSFEHMHRSLPKLSKRLGFFWANALPDEHAAEWLLQNQQYHHGRSAGPI